MSVYRIAIKQGATFVLPMQWLADSVPVDLTGATAKLEMRDKVGGTVLATFSSPASGIAIVPSTGTLTLTITAAQTAAFGFTHAVYDLLVTLADGTTKERFIEGSVVVSPQVTT